MRILIASLLAAAAVGLVAPARAPAAEKSKRCPDSGKRVVAVSKQAAVYFPSRAAERSRLYRACDRRTGHSFALLRKGTLVGRGVERGLGKPVLTGPYVALTFIRRSRDEPGPQFLLRAYDTGTRKRLVSDVEVYNGSSVHHAAKDKPLDELIVARDGAVAWMATPPRSGVDPESGFDYGPTEIDYDARNAPLKTLDASPGIASGSLALSRRFVYWRDGVIRSAPR